MQGGEWHLKVRCGAVIDASATIIGNIEIGEGAIAAAALAPPDEGNYPRST